MNFQFIKEILSSETDLSSKRFNGTIAYLLAALAIITISLSDFFKDWTLSNISESLLEIVLWSGAALLGATAVEKIWTSKSNGSTT